MRHALVYDYHVLTAMGKFFQKINFFEGFVLGAGGSILDEK